MDQVIQTLSDTPRPAKTRADFDGTPAALLSFTITSEGKVTTLQLDESSNDAALDRAASSSISKVTTATEAIHRYHTQDSSSVSHHDNCR